MNSAVSVIRSSLENIQSLREEYLRRVNAQVVHDAWHRRGRTTIYQLSQGHEVIGYGAVGGSSGEPHETVKEFFVLPRFEVAAESVFQRFLTEVQPKWLDAQSNDPYLATLVSRFALDHEARANLFEDGGTTDLQNPGVVLRRVTEQDQASLFAHTTEPVGDWGLELDGTLVATGGMYFHYNPPYGDLYMEVAMECRGRGYASYLVQELKRICYEGGHVPAARCDIGNVASRKALLRAGMRQCGQLIHGRIKA
jgi:RimJ/RimL family protein N-acetyltransferase